MQKIMILFHDSDIKSGGTGSMMDLVVEWKKMNQFDPICVFPKKRGSAIEYALSHGIKVEYLRFYPVFIYTTLSLREELIMLMKRIIQFMVTLLNLPRASAMIKKNNIELVYTNTRTVLLGVYINKLYKIPHIWHIREYGMEDRGIKFLISDHTYSKYFRRYTNYIVLISKSINKFYEQRFALPCHKVVYDDVSSRYICTIKKEMEKPVKVLIAGTICEGKGQLEVVKAILRVNEVEERVNLYIAGRCIERRYLEEIEALKKEHDRFEAIKILGLVENMNELRSQMDISIVASRSEAFGRVTIEGMLSGLIVVGADCGGTSELIENGRNGFLYKKGDITDLQNILDLILNFTPEEIYKIKTNGFKSALEFTKGRCAEETSKIIIGLLK